MRPQSDPPRFRRFLARRQADAAAIYLLFVALSAAIGALAVLPRVEREIRRDSNLTPFERHHYAAVQLGVDVKRFDAFRARLRLRQPYSVDVPEGRKGPFITSGAVIRAFSAYYFLPAIQKSGAKPVFHYRFR